MASIGYPRGYLSRELEEQDMCRPVACKKCGKTTWAGCGQHVDSVMASVPKSEQCRCADEPQAAVGAQQKSGGWFSSLFGR